MSQIAETVRFARGLYAQKAAGLYQAYGRRDPLALLQHRPGRTNPYRIYEDMRAQGPLLPTRLGNWSTTSHALCREVLRDRAFGVRPQGAAAPAPSDAFDLSLLELNPPDHTRLRRLAAPAFSPSRMDGYRARVSKVVHALIDDITAAISRGGDHGIFDLVPAFAAPLPIAVITDLLGIPDTRDPDWPLAAAPDGAPSAARSLSEQFAGYGAAIGGALDGIRAMRHARRLYVADRRLETLFTDLFELRRRQPGDDIVSVLVAAEGDQIQPAEMLPLCTLLLIAGFETTVNLIGNGMLALLHHPDQWRALTDDPRRAPQAVEEMLRYDPPVQRTARVAQCDTELAGQPVHRDQLVVTFLGAANRDPDVFAEPDRFDIGRGNAAEHLAFSAGIHYCLGQPLARLEAGIAFEALASRLPGLRLAGRVRRRNATTIRGPISLPLSTL